MYQAILLLPLLGAIFAGFFGRLVGARSSEVITTTLVLITALLSYLAFYQVALTARRSASSCCAGSIPARSNRRGRSGSTR